MDPLLVALVVGLPAIACLVLVLGRIAYRAMIGMEVLSSEDALRETIRRGDMRGDELELPWILAELPSASGYRLAARALRGEESRVAIFHHGVSWSWVGMLRYMELFRDLGWTVVAFDARGHGASGGGRPSYGFYEREDLVAVVDWACASFPHSGGLVLVGESMGAATVLQYAPRDARVDAVVADCSFSSAAAELDSQLARSFVPRLLRPLVLRAADRLCRSREGFSLYEASPEAAVLETEVPILFVHGLEDIYVPWRMSVAMAERRRRALPQAITELRLVPGARHARSVSVDPAGYAASLHSFLAVALADRGKGV